MKKLILCIIILLAMSGCVNLATEHSDKTIIRVAYLPITHSIALMMMEEFNDEGSPYQIELIRFTTWPDVVDALRTGRVDGASILFEVALQARNVDDGLVLLGLSHRDGNVIVVDNSIESYQDLIGKIVAIPHRLSPQNTLLQMVLKRENISPYDIQIIEISPAEMPFSMASGSIAAYIVAEPFGAIAENAGVGRVIETSDQISSYSVCCVLVFRDESIASPSLHTWLLESFATAAEAAHKRNYRVVNTFMEHARLTADVVERALENTRFEDLQFTQEEYNEITAAIISHGILESIPLFEEFIY